MNNRGHEIYHTIDVLDNVLDERRRQNDKWGEQNHPDGTNIILLQTANRARSEANEAAKQKRLTWAYILNEEFYEAMAEEDPNKLRGELIQVAAVAVAWIECIDRREYAAQEEVTP